VIRLRPTEDGHWQAHLAETGCAVMKVLQTPVRFYPAVGGVEQYVLGLSAQLVRRGHAVTVICADEPASDMRQVQGVQVKRLWYAGKIANTNITLPLLMSLLREDFDVIHTHMPTPWSAELSLLAARLKRKPCVLTYHNDVEKTGLLGALTRVYNALLLPILLAGADKILITQPRYLADSRVLSPYRDKIAVIPNGIAFVPDSCPGPGQAARLLFVSVLDNFHRYKGLEYLLQAVARLARERPEVRLDVVGTGGLLGEYQALADRLQLGQRVRFWGYVDDEQLGQLYRQCTVFVLPSVDAHEGFGIVLLEAMAHARPVITTHAVGLADELTACQAGAAVPPSDPAALAVAIGQIIDQPELAARMGENGRQRVCQKYLWDGIAEKVEQIYMGLTGRTRHPLWS
jgi:glycosyltransferase involved in cell wall biosynthesis